MVSSGVLHNYSKKMMKHVIQLLLLKNG